MGAVWPGAAAVYCPADPMCASCCPQVDRQEGLLGLDHRHLQVRVLEVPQAVLVSSKGGRVRAPGSSLCMGRRFGRPMEVAASRLVSPGEQLLHG